MFTTLALVAAAALMADGVAMKFIGSGVTAKVGGYRPLRAEMDGEAASVKKAPAGLVAPKYGTIKIGEQSWVFILDEPEGQPAKLFVDTNGDGDLTNDPDISWSAKTTDSLTMYDGKAQVDLGNGDLGTLGMYRFDPKDSRRGQLKNTMMFYTDYGYEVTLQLDEKKFTSFVSGKPTANGSLAIDRDGNHRTSFKLEVAYFGKPFNFTGTTYVLKVSGDQLQLATAVETLPIAPLPPDLRIGKKAVPFSMVAMDGTKIEFPQTFAGKLVMLDFWATWCGPCIAELPNVKKAYETWHERGFEVLGISFDKKDMTDKLNKFAKDHEVPWRQIYEGKLWDTTLGSLYDVSGIPFVLLVDGDSGEILATAKELRGPGLSDVIGKALAKKQGATN